MKAIINQIEARRIARTIPRAAPDDIYAECRDVTKNVLNDRKHEQDLRDMGWIPITLWECELEADFEKTMEKTINEIIRIMGDKVGDNGEM